MKTQIKIGLSLSLILVLTSCRDEFNVITNNSVEGNFIIRLYNGKTLSSRAEETPGNTSINTDEYFIAEDDYKFYIFDEEDKFVQTLGPEDRPSVAYPSINITEYGFEVSPYMNNIKVMALTNLKGYNGNNYPIYEVGTPLNTFFTDYKNLLTYPETGGMTWVPGKGAGIPMAGVSANTEVVNAKTEVQVPVIRALAKIEVQYGENIEPLPSLDGKCRIYILNNSPWSDVYVYGWFMEDGGTTKELCGEWPGVKSTGRTVVAGEEYLYFDIDLGTVQNDRWNLIFHNGRDIQINGPQSLELRNGAKYYYELTGRNSNNVSWTIVNLQYIHSGKVVYALNKTPWEEMYLYAYSQGADADLNNKYAWPGIPPSGQEIINGETYLFYDLGEIIGSDAMFIFNNNAKGIQSQDIGPYDLTSNTYAGGVYFEVTDYTTEAIEWSTDGYTIYVKKNDLLKNDKNWESLYLYLYGERNDITGLWPGERLTQTTQINGEEYYYYHFDKEITGLKENIILNNGVHANANLDFQITVLENYNMDHDVYFDLKDCFTNVEVKTHDYDENNPYKIYVENKVAGWNNVNLYIWGDNINDWVGEWPGIPGEIEIIDGKSYYVFTLPDPYIEIEVPDREEKEVYEVTHAHLILNNGIKGPENGEDQLADFYFTLNGDMYLTIQKAYCEQQYGLKHDTPRIRVENNSNWDDVYVYSWGDSEIFGGWPGQHLNKTNDGYYNYQFNETIKNAHLIFNNGNGGGNNQFDYGDYEGYTYNSEKDIYITIDAKHAGLAQDITGSESVTRPDEEDAYIKGVNLTFYTKDGCLIPDLSESKNSNWNIENQGVDEPTVPSGAENATNLGFKYDSGVNGTHYWIAYIPEMEGLNVERPKVEIDFRAFPSVIPFDLDDYEKVEKSDEINSAPSPENSNPEEITTRAGNGKMQSVLRNNIYHYNVNLYLEELLINYTVCPWDKDEETEIRFE